MVGVVLVDALEEPHGFLCVLAARLLQALGEPETEEGIFRRGPRRLAEQRQRFDVATGVPEHGREVAHREQVVRLLFDGGAQVPCGSLVVAAAGIRHPKRDVRIGVVGIEPNAVLQDGNRVRDPPELAQADAAARGPV